MRSFTQILSSPNAEAPSMGVMAKVLALRALGNGTIAADQIAESIGASSRVVNVMKAAVAGGTTGNWGAAAVDRGTIVAAFVEAMRNSSLFYRLLNSLIKVPFQERVGFVTVGASSWVVGEGKPTPLTALGLDDTFLEPVKAAAVMVVTKELLNASQSEAALNRELRRGVSSEVDSKFLDLITDGDTPSIASTGTDMDAVRTDLLALLTAVNLTAESKPVFGLAPDVARRASVMLTLAGGFMFPGMTPMGGEILGIDAIATDSLAAGTMALLDGQGIIGDSLDIELDASGQVSLEMKNSALGTDATSGTGAALTSMWQTNTMAIKAVASFGAKRHPARDNAIAYLTDVAWGGAIPVS